MGLVTAKVFRLARRWIPVEVKDALYRASRRRVTAANRYQPPQD